MSVSHQFGGSWTEDKLDRLHRYLIEYMKIMNKQNFATSYVDAFAGTGTRQSSNAESGQYSLSLFTDVDDISDAATYHRGSAQIALSVEPPFGQYYFVENNPAFVSELENLHAQYPARSSRIHIQQEDANRFLPRWSSQLGRYDRAVVFLDPYGMSVDWFTISALARTQKVDLWILFPLGVAVNRLLTRRQPPPVAWADALTRFFGTDDWRSEFYRISAQPGLFSEEPEIIKDTDFISIADYFIRRLQSEFAGVATNYRTLRNSRNSPLYLLCFASSNPKGAPTAVKIASYILGR